MMTCGEIFQVVIGDSIFTRGQFLLLFLQNISDIARGDRREIKLISDFWSRHDRLSHEGRPVYLEWELENDKEKLVNASESEKVGWILELLLHADLAMDSS